MIWLMCSVKTEHYAAVAELADALDSKSSGAIRAGSSPATGIKKVFMSSFTCEHFFYYI